MATGKYRSITVNERLYASGKMDKFEKAVAAREIEKAKAILNELELTDRDIQAVLDSFGLR